MSAAPVVVAAPAPAPLPTGAPHLPRPSASLYVGNLAYDVQEANLYEIFNQVGPVASIRVCRDSFTRRSLGYAYVNFHTPVDAERALDTLNYAPIKGRACRIMWSQRDPALRKSGQGNIFIKNLDKTIDNKTLHDTFSAFGNILSCRVMADENGNSLGFGYVHFENSESAKSAITKINGMLLNGKKVYVGPHLSKRERDSKFDQNQKTFTNVFVKNLDDKVTEEEFVAVFSKFGSITSAVIMKDEQGKSKGFGFVNYTTHEAALNACEEKNEDTLNESHPDKNLYVGRAKKKTEMRKENLEKSEMFKQEKQSKYQGVNLYIKNLDDTVDDERLRKEFEVFGTITSAKVQLDEKSHSRGFGFVCYNSAEEATKAVTEMNGRMIENKPIYVALAQRKEQRRQQLEVLYNQRSQMRLAQTTGVLGPLYPQPVFYGQQMGIPPQNRVNQQFIYPPIPRPRWNGPQVPGAPQGQEMLGGYPPQGPGAQVGRPPRMGGNVNGPRRGPPTGIPPQRSGIPNGLAQPQMSAGPTRGKGYRYTGNVRNNRPEQGQPLNQIPLSAASLADQDPQLQKQLLGTRLYELVFLKDQQNAPKITGMLLDLDTTELLHLIDSDEALTAKVEEALSVLHEEGGN